MEETKADVPAFFEENPGDLIREHRQYYLMVNAMSRRVRQLQLGERALALPASGSRDPVYIAEEEFLQDKLDITPRRYPLFSTRYAEDEAMESDMDMLLGIEDEGDDFNASEDDE